MMTHQGVLHSQIEINYDDRAMAFLDIKSVTRKALILGVLTFIFSMFSKILPSGFAIISDGLVIVYSVALVFFSFFSSLAYAIKSSPFSIKQENDGSFWGAIAFWSMLEVIFLGISIFFTSKYIKVNTIIPFTTFYISIFALLTIYLQWKWNQHCKQWRVDALILVKDSKSQRVKEFLTKVYDFGDTTEMFPPEASAMKIIVNFRWVFFAISFLISLAYIIRFY